MKPSNEEKARFFAQYWRQRVFGFGNPGDDNSLLTVCGHYLDQGYSSPFSEDLLLRLKPLSSISDEDAIEVATLLGFMHGKAENAKAWLETYNKFQMLALIPVKTSIHAVFDFLRRKSYAVDFDKYTVGEMIEWGWIKLKP